MRNKEKNSKPKSRKKDVVYLGVFLAGFLAYSVLMTHFLGHACPINLIFGVPCPGCGLTRAWLCVFHGSFTDAFLMHPLFWTVPLIAVFFFIGFFSEKFADSLAIKILAALGVATFLGVYIYRMVRFFPAQEEPMCFNSRSLLFWLRSLVEKL